MKKILDVVGGEDLARQKARSRHTAVSIGHAEGKKHVESL